MKVCPVCKKNKENSDFYIRTDGSKRLSSYCKVCNTAKKREVTKEIKRKAVEYKGGKCKMCGYNKNLAALDFHHINPDEKEFRLGRKQSINFEILKKELDKCILVCSNCHRELHASLA